MAFAFGDDDFKTVKGRGKSLIENLAYLVDMVGVNSSHPFHAQDLPRLVHGFFDPSTGTLLLDAARPVRIESHEMSGGMRMYSLDVV